MADGVKYQHHETKIDEPCEAPAVPKSEECFVAVETSDRGLFDFVGKKKEEKKCGDQEEVIVTELDQGKVQVCEEPKEEEKKHEGLLEKLHRSGSSSSSSSDEEEVDESGEKKKKKKGLKDKTKEKISGEKEEEENAEVKCEDTDVPIEKCDDAEDKKRFLDKIKEKLPRGKKLDEVAAPPMPPPSEECASVPEEEGKEKKGFLDKIKEKLPGYHSKSVEEKEKEKEACH